MDIVYYVKEKWKQHDLVYRYRYDPVPGIHKCGGYRGFRHVRTFHEMKWSFADPEYVRPARRKPNLPSLWDDKYSSDGYVKSWKHCTKKPKQWM